MNFQRVLHNVLDYIKQKPVRCFLIACFITLFLYFIFCLPNQIFNEPLSSLILDRKGKVLSARIAKDGQWRFPEIEKVPEKFEKCIIEFEDQNFYWHPGVDLFAIFRALKQNLSSGKIISGGSTIPMQVIRLSRKNSKRNYFEKMVEMIWATRLSLSNSKKNILCLYASYAPFGSNIVGLEAASWRYFGRSPEELSWAESATLAVLPNAPAMIYPGKNQSKLLKKRNQLLTRLKSEGIISEEDFLLALNEPLPVKAFGIPNRVPHLLQKSVADLGEGQRIATSIDEVLQQNTDALVNEHAKLLQSNEIHNACAVIIKISTGEILAYVGNTKKNQNEDHGNEVDVINSPRSTGSLLKPFLYGMMLNDGILLPNTLVPDIPTQIGGFAPKNFNLTYDGAVPAHRALERSLNVPCVKMLQQYGLEKFHYNLKRLGLTTITRPANDYGMSIILGGAEGKLLELCSAYSQLAHQLKEYNTNHNRNSEGDNYQISYLNNEIKKTNDQEKQIPKQLMDPASIFLTFEAMAEVSRPDIDASWQRLSSSQKIAWKTGTSFGFRDGWAIGLTKEYVVGVWAGNADGEGRPGLTGISCAAPLLFKIFGILPKTNSWFEKPVNEMKRIEVCAKSGHRVSTYCDEKIIQMIPSGSQNSMPCPYHKTIALNKEGMARVNADCYNTSDIRYETWFVLPPAIEHYYKNKNVFYKTLPPIDISCVQANVKSMEMIYPKVNAKIFVPVEISGKQGKTVFEVAHNNSNATIYWDLDGNYLGSTTNFHQMGLNPEKGFHRVTVTDDKGESITIPFEVISSKK
jgi:penicillin-binding protein 1C